MVFANGVGLETWLDPLLNNVRPGTPVVKLGDESGIQLFQGSGDEQSQGDPHVWQDPTNAQKMVARIRTVWWHFEPIQSRARLIGRFVIDNLW